MPTRVVQLIGSFHQGGSERQALHLARLLHASGRYQMMVASLDPAGSLRSEVQSLGIAVQAFPLTSFHDRGTVIQMRRLVRLLRQGGIDVVQTHDYYTNMFGMLAGALAGRPVRIASLREIGGVRTPLQRRLERIAFRLAHAIVVNADAIRRQMVSQNIAARKVVLIPNALDSARVARTAPDSRREALAAVGLPPHTPAPVVTIVANMHHPVKDQETFLHAAQRVGRVHPRVSFVLAGEGERRPHLQSFAAGLGLESQVFFIGRCGAIGDLLALSDVCVLSSRAEGMSNAILEYMAAGRPVVTTDVGGAAEMVIEADTGYLVAAADDATMAERIMQLLADPQRANAMGARGQQRVRRLFSNEALLRRTETLYDRLLAGRRR